MKEAAGEANMTVITIVLIAIVLAVGTLIVNRLMRRTQLNSCCSEAGGYISNGQCRSFNTTTYSNCTAGNRTSARIGG